jgi:hypothetical protein
MRMVAKPEYTVRTIVSSSRTVGFSKRIPLSILTHKVVILFLAANLFLSISSSA